MLSKLVKQGKEKQRMLMLAVYVWAAAAGLGFKPRPSEEGQEVESYRRQTRHTVYLRHSSERKNMKSHSEKENIQRIFNHFHVSHGC